MSRFAAALAGASLLLATLAVADGAVAAPPPVSAVVTDPTGDVLTPPSDALADQAPWLGGIDLSAVTYSVQRTGRVPALTIVYRAADVRSAAAPGEQQYGTFIGADDYVEVHSAKTPGTITLIDRHLARPTVRCAGGTERRDEVAETVTQVVPLSCLRAAARVSGSLWSWSRAWRGGGKPRQDTTATSPVLDLHADGHPASVKAPRRGGPSTIELRADSPRASALPASAPADLRAYGDLTSADIAVHRAGTTPHLTVVYHVGAVAPADLEASGLLVQRFTLRILQGPQRHDVSEGPVPGSVGLQRLPTCLPGREIRDAAAGTVTQVIPLACLAGTITKSVRMKARVFIASFPYYAGDSTRATPAVPLSSRATR